MSSICTLRQFYQGDYCIYSYDYSNLLIFNMASLDVTAARARFPALQQEQVFMDNAGSLH